MQILERIFGFLKPACSMLRVFKIAKVMLIVQSKKMSGELVAFDGVGGASQAESWNPLPKSGGRRCALLLEVRTHRLRVSTYKSLSYSI